MDWPEESAPTIRLILHQPKMAIVDYCGKDVASISPLHTIAEFEHTGKSYWHVIDGVTESIKIYVLRDIIKH